jgi:hypothetical protein
MSFAPDMQPVDPRFDPAADAVPFPPPRPEERTSVRLRRLIDSLEADRVHVGYLIIQLRRRSFGGLLILLAVLGLLPGISLLAGLVMLLPALQMVVGLRAPAMPRFVRRRAVSVAGLRGVVNRAMPGLEWLEGYVRPRWPIMTQPPFANLAGLLIACLALMLLLPLPLSNLPPAIAIAALALALLERDGVAMAIGFVLGIVALVVGWFGAIVALNMLLAFAADYYGYFE